MGKLIGFVSGKGGAGKTTITEIVCSALTMYYDYTIAVIDTDVDQPSMNVDRKDDLRKYERDDPLTLRNVEKLTEKGKEPFKIFTIEPTNIAAIAKVKKEFDIVFLDVPGSLSIKGVKELYYFMDYAYIPFYVDKKSVESTISTLELLSNMFHSQKSRLKGFGVFFNRYNGEKGKNSAYFRRFGDWLDKQGVKRLKPVYENIEFQRKYASTINPPPYNISKKSIYTFIEDLLINIKEKK